MAAITTVACDARPVGLLEIRELYLPAESILRDEPLHIVGVELDVVVSSPLDEANFWGHSGDLQGFYVRVWRDGCDACSVALSLDGANCRFGARAAADGWSPTCTYEAAGKGLAADDPERCSLDPEAWTLHIEHEPIPEAERDPTVWDPCGYQGIRADLTLRDFAWARSPY